MNQTNQWKLERSGLTCQTCSIQIEPGSHFWSRLVDQKDSETGLQRLDYCEAHWPAEGESFCFWKTTRKVEEDRGPRILDTDTLLTIFRELNPETTESRKINFRYLLALILMRKKMLKEIAGGDAQTLHLTDTVETWSVAIPDMDQEAHSLAEEDIGQLIVGLPVKEESSESEAST